MRTLSSRLEKHILVAAAVATGATAVANAAIIYSGPVNINIPSNIDGVYMNIVTGATGTSGSTTTGWDINPYSSTSLSFFSNGATSGYVTSGGLASNLAFNTSISGASTFGTGVVSSGAGSLWNLSSSNNLLGFKFFNEGTGQTNYGWARLSLGSTLSAQPRAIVEYAYENTGAAIGAGVPAPGALALLGLAGLAGKRRRA